jgi:hypothetical protein
MRRTLLLAALLVLTAAVAVAYAQQAAPTVATGSATSVKQSSAVLNGTVTPNGADADWYFAYGTTTAYGQKTATKKVTAGQGTRSVSATVSGLASGTTYHYQLVAANSGGTAVGADKTFNTTGPADPVVTLKTSSDPVTFGKTVTLSGQVAGPGNAGVTVTLQARAYPYSAAFKKVGNSLLTNNTGKFAFTSAPLLKTQYRAVARKANVNYFSAVVLQRVRIRVGTFVSDSTPRSGQRVRFSGSAMPSHPGAVVRVQRRSSTGKYVTIAKSHLRAYSTTRSTYSLRARIRTTAYYRVRVSTSDGDHSSGIGTRKRLRVH